MIYFDNIHPDFEPVPVDPGSVTGIGKDAFVNCDDSLTITVSMDSNAAQYCKENDLRYTGPDNGD